MITVEAIIPLRFGADKASINFWIGCALIQSPPNTLVLLTRGSNSRDGVAQSKRTGPSRVGDRLLAATSTERHNERLVTSCQSPRETKRCAFHRWHDERGGRFRS
jgi:hypothetical protein